MYVCVCVVNACVYVCVGLCVRVTVCGLACVCEREGEIVRECL